MPFKNSNNIYNPASCRIIKVSAGVNLEIPNSLIQKDIAIKGQGSLQ